MSRQNQLEHEQNRLRGAIANLQRRGRDERELAMASRTGIRKALLTARENVAVNDRRKLFEWLDALAVGANAKLGAALRSDLTNSALKSKGLPFASELDWIRLRMQPHTDFIRAFRDTASKISNHFWRRDQTSLYEELARAENEFGPSLWLLDAEIAIRQEFDGLEAQKEAFKSVSKRYPGGLPTYLAYNASVRNEPRSSYDIFKEDFNRRLDRFGFEEQLRQYLTYKVLGQTPTTASSFSTIVRFEQGQSLIDLYETTIDLLQRQLAFGDPPIWSDEAIALLTAWLPINDWRVAKLLFGYSGQLISLPAQSLNHSSERDTGNSFDAMAACVSFIDAGVLSPDETDLSEEHRKTYDELRLLWRREGDFEDARSRLSKNARNFSFDPAFKAVGAAVDYATMANENSMGALGAIALNSPGFLAADCCYVVPDRLAAARINLTAITPKSAINEWISSEQPPLDPSLRPSAWYLRALRLRGIDPDSALDIATTIPNDALTPTQRALTSNLRIQLNLTIGEWKAAVTEISREIALSSCALGVVPVQPAVGDRPWESLNSVSDKLDLSLSLYALWKQTDDSLAASYLRFSFEEVLIEHKVQLPSEIAQTDVEMDSRLLFFLANICIPVLMDTSGFFSSSDELLDERLAILSKLQLADTENLEAYEYEEAKLHANRLIKSGLQLVDSNRVTVDENALLRAASRQYREAYARYVALSAANIGGSAKYEDILDEISKSTDASGEYFTVPRSEADTLLLEILLGLKEQFLGNAQYGLEYFLGKRVRHGTIAGHMRGPAEDARLITERKAPSFPYETNEYWLEKIPFPDNASRARASQAFNDFSENYDIIIAEVRDELLHVASGQHTQGIFEVIITAPQFHIVKSVVRSEIEFDLFARMSFQIFWRILAPSLDRAQILLRKTITDRVVKLFGTLQAALKATAATEDSCNQVSIAIQSASTQVQRELDTVASWFDRAEARHGANTFTLSQALEIAIHSSLNSLTNFRPNIIQKVIGDRKTSSAVLLILWEFLFVVLDNVYRRAKVGNEPEVSIDCQLDRDSKTLSVRVLNPIGEQVDCTEIEQRLNRTREKIAAGDILRGANADKGSGLLKMASLCRELQKSQMSFGITDDRLFFTEINLPVFVSSTMFSISFSDLD